MNNQKTTKILKIRVDDPTKQTYSIPEAKKHKNKNKNIFNFKDRKFVHRF